MKPKHTNQLVHETSPYLLQHAHNPVNWYPWGENALGRARRENKLIFLSIGYAACHWCHVMEHESFEHEDVAEILNHGFIAIKVDREERPDLDEIYMTATMLYTGGHGGWPMSVFLSPSLQPVYAGTYFPKENMYGRPGFKTLLSYLEDAWEKKPSTLKADAEKVVAAMLKMHTPEESSAILPQTSVSTAAKQLWEAFDSSLGGLASGNNKFPPSLSMDLLLREHRNSAYEPFRSTVELTLEKMGNGGIYDHLGGGIHRYSTDPKWQVPHFEKMLYDQAMVASIYLDGIQATEHPKLEKLFAEKATGIFDYVLRDLRSPEGAFYSSEDADSEEMEGKFYLWTLEEILKIAGDEAGRLFAAHYDVTEVGNWEHPGDEHVPTGPKNILQISRPIAVIANLDNLDPLKVEASICEVRQKLFETREERARPGLDDKILAGWNGLMIAALANGAMVLGKQGYAENAVQAAEFILDAMLHNRQLLATYGRGQARLKAYITDYAFLIKGLLALYEWRGELRWIDAAEQLLDTAIEYHWDETSGGFFFTASNHEKLVVRSKTATDGAIPSGNSVMLTNLQKLSILLNRKDLREKAEQIIRVFAGEKTMHSPFQHEQLLSGIESWHQGFEEIAIIGPRDEPETKELLRSVYRVYIPNKIVANLNDVKDQETPKRIPLLANRPQIDGKPTAYVCRNFTCEKPTVDPKELREQLKARK